MQPRKVFENDEIVRAVREGLCRRPPLKELANKDYYADDQGNIYSLNGDEPKQIEAKTGWGGFRWVVLATVDGWHRYHVGEIIAETFLKDRKPRDGDYTVQYINGNTDDNRVDNLAWITRIEANAMRQATMGRAAAGKKREHRDALANVGLGETTGRNGKSHESSTARSKEEEIQELLERNRRTQKKLDALKTDYAEVLEALRVFGEHTLSAELRLGHPDTPVIESNRGKADHGVITVADFRRAKDTLDAIERRRKG